MMRCPYVSESSGFIPVSNCRNCQVAGMYALKCPSSPRPKHTNFGEGVPVLDWEGDQGIDWVNEFVRVVHDQTGIWPWIYANPWRFNQGGVEPNCMRWIASYPDVLRPGLDYDPGEPPETDGLVGCWQYASDGQVPGYAGNLDVNHFFGSVGAWQAYAGVPSTGAENKPTGQSVLENDRFRVTIQEK